MGTYSLSSPHMNCSYSLVWSITDIYNCMSIDGKDIIIIDHNSIDTTFDHMTIYTMWNVNYYNSQRYRDCVGMYDHINRKERKYNQSQRYRNYVGSYDHIIMRDVVMIIHNGIETVSEHMIIYIIYIVTIINHNSLKPRWFIWLYI